MMKKERIFYYDFLRAFAIIGVIICHVDMFFGPLTTPLEIIAQQTFHDIGRMGVPIFLMISGALLLNKDYEITFFLKRRMNRIVYPFIFWMTLIIASLIFIKYSYSEIWNVFIGNDSITWYFWMIIGIYLAIPILNSFIKEYKETGLKYFIIIWLFVMGLQTFNRYPLIPFLTLDFFANYIGYPMLGYYLSQKTFKTKNSRVCVFALIIFLISISTYVYSHYVGSGLMNMIYLNIPIVLMVSSIFVIVRLLDESNKFNSIKNNAIGKIINSISVYSYGMYFSQLFGLKVCSLINPHSNLLFPLIFTFIIFTSWLLPYIVSKIPYLKIFSGA